MGMAGRKRAPEEAMVRGSVVLHRRRCGKATCPCADGTVSDDAMDATADGAHNPGGGAVSAVFDAASTGGRYPA